MPPSIGVVDVETTGLFPGRSDRILEIAAVVMGLDGHIEREYCSLTNPQRDLGPRRIHGLSSADLVSAPTFRDIVGDFISALDGCIAIAGHNVRFDNLFISNEFERLGLRFPQPYAVCTMQLAGGGRLEDCCRDYGVQFDGRSHNALNDARAAGHLLSHLLRSDKATRRALEAKRPIKWPTVSWSSSAALTRSESLRKQEETPSFLQVLLTRSHKNGKEAAATEAALSYRNLLDQALEDRNIDQIDSNALLESATFWGLSANQATQIHQSYLRDLAVAAAADGTVTSREYADLRLVARLLGLSSQLDTIIREGRSGPAKKPPPAGRAGLRGKIVCFTGELQMSHAGSPISREHAHELARAAGLKVLDNVTKSLDILVVADPLTQSGKAQKARKYGVRIVHERVFWEMIGIQVD
jgi:DNA polymerase-3 subunit epsilon